MLENKQIEQEDDLTLKDIVLKVRTYFYEVLRYWYIPAFFALIGLAYQLYKYYDYEPVYPAMITFSVDEDEGGGQSALTGMLSQFGLGGARPVRYNFDKILELSKSRRVIQRTLFAKITVDGKEDYIANHLIRLYEFNPATNETDSESSFYFTHDSLPAFSRLENEMLISLYGFIIGPPNKPEKALLSAGYNDDTNIMSLTATTRNETLSLEFSRLMFQSLSDYYINKAIEKSLKTYKIVTTKRDSVLGELRSAEYRLANFMDSHRSMPMRTDRITELRLQRDVAALTTMYTEVLKNAEVADFNLRSKTPFIQVIDSPIPPIYPVQISFLRTILLGLIIGGGIGVLLVVIRKAFRDMMAGPG